jgi:uncharacterized phage infection (PIP) family protein YhgE
MTDPSSLNDTLVKSPRWKENTLQEIEDGRSAATPDLAKLEQGFTSISEDLAQQLQEARRQLRKQSMTLHRHSDKIRQMGETIVQLQNKNNGLIARQERELDARRVALVDFQVAYDQFEQESDQVLSELDKKYRRL